MVMKQIFFLVCAAVVMWGEQGTPGGGRGRGAFFPVKPVINKQTGASLRIGNGRFFSYALPEGWHVGEDGQFALTVVAADNKAFTVMVGNAGVPANYQPMRFVYDKL